MLESLSLTARQRAMSTTELTAFLSTELKNSDHRGRAADSRHEILATVKESAPESRMSHASRVIRTPKQ
jgi:hypothetical protein